MFLVYRQKRRVRFDEVPVASSSREGRLHFRVSDFAKKYDLGEPLAANFFQAAWDEFVDSRLQMEADAAAAERK